jgi:NAD-dependent SIR2 family protein deacetylase
VGSYDNRIEQAKKSIMNAEYILIGGGAGLSDAAGLKYTGKRFTDNFADFIKKYGFKDLYTSSFYPFKTQEERWAYWAKHISINRYEEPASEVYKNLFSIVQGKKYFVITTNVEHQFVISGFPEEKVFAVQGNYGLLQCERACHKELYDNEKQVKAMLANMEDCKIPSALVPECPVCNGEMDVNLRHNNYFVQDKNWYEAQNHYEEFLKSCHCDNVIYLELGVGFNTPGIIRFPFEQMTYHNENATLIRINRDHPNGQEENADKTIAFSEDMGQIIKALI